MILTLWVMAFYAVVVFGLSSVSFSFKSIPGRCDKRIAFFFCSSDLVPLQLTALHRDAARIFFPG